MEKEKKAEMRGGWRRVKVEEVREGGGGEGGGGEGGGGGGWG